ncbi:MAG: bifunctional diaminohydroxyphosphoribosylaminopyrimidine deaminase/5-amino-6-(5-phosphoribosylamino)uracil reductase RibD [Deltaproteobacteria bacterium]|nr:bifunctional diaminohydroxyphosphoribosylaminopyrimidine deaminase/5-amino-6-(5-phosphoribosylamino)uracil reductase RibD [Deltaproteobacteria bacterium]
MRIIHTPLDEALASFREPGFLEPVSAEVCIHLASLAAYAGAGWVHLNPLVGAVAVDSEHRFLASAAHLAFGNHHAEKNLVDKIRQKGMGASLKGGTIYVTLEPCCHYGKTPPCTELLISLGLKRIVYGMIDPNPVVNGKGIRLLEAQGISCETSPQFAELSAPLLELYRWNLEQKTPFVAMKAASTLNGIACREGDKRMWLTSERARDYGHWLRQYYQAILVGANTVIADNPTLNMRHPRLKGRTPLRIVLDRRGDVFHTRSMDELNLLKGEPERVLFACGSRFWKSEKGQSTRHNLEKRGVQTIALRDVNRLQNLLEELRARDVASILLEGGPKIWGAFLSQKLVNKVHLFMAPSLFASRGGMNVMSHANEDLALKDQSLILLADDFLMEGRL